MSFIFQDKNLLETLFKLAQQATPAVAPKQDNTAKDIAKKLFSTLQPTLEEASSNSFSSDKDNARLRTNNLTNLNSLFNFLNFNNIKYNGNPIILKHDQSSQGMASGAGDAAFANLSKDVQSQYVKYPEPQTDEGNDFQYWINQNGIAAYMQDLNKESEKNALLKPYIAKLTQQLNSADISTSVKETKIDNSNVVVDILPSIINIKVPLQRTSSGVNLTPKDLASKNSFQSWFKINNLTYAFDGANLSWDNIPDEEICNIISVLHQRANSYAYRSSDEKYKAYIEAVNNIASQFTCNISSSSNKQNSSNYQNASYTTSNGGFTPQAVNAISNLDMPLIQDQIVFSRINQFTKQIKILSPQLTITQTVEDTLSKLANNYPGITIQDLNTTNFDEISKLIQDTNGKGSGADYVATLGTLLQSTEQMLLTLSQMLLKGGGGPTALDLKKDIDDQIQNVYRNNIYGVRRLQGQLNNHLNDIAKIGR